MGTTFGGGTCRIRLRTIGLTRPVADYRPPVSHSTPLPTVGAPATRALTAAGYRSLEDLDGQSRTALLALHGVGPRAIRILDQALAELGLSLVD